MTRPFSQSDSGRALGLITSPAHPCAYMPGREAATAFIDPAIELTNDLYSKLAELGFRRSGSYIYRPACPSCNACIAVRVPAANFRQRRRERRVWTRNLDITVSPVPCAFREEHFLLFQAYIGSRHAGGGMDTPDPQQYQSFFNNSWSDTRLYEFRHGHDLLAVAITDHLCNGLSAVYTFFDPGAPQRSLGIFAILWQIQEAQRRKLQWLYLGYWIEECPKMNYKGDFRPLQAYQSGQWTLL